MSADRTRYAHAYGPYKNFQARSDNLLTQSDATPDVTLGSVFYAVNTGATVITDFDGGEEGQVITLIMIDGGSTSVANSGELVLAGSGDFSGNNNVISLIQHNTSWYEISRSQNQTSYVLSVQSGSNIAADVINVNGKTQIAVNTSTGAPVNIDSLSNGYDGQHVTVLALGSAVAVVNSVGAINLMGSGNLALANSGTLELVKNGGQWFEVASNFNADTNVVALPPKGATSANHVVTINKETKMIYMNASGGTATQLRNLQGGVPGQVVTVYAPNSAVIIVTSAGPTCMYDAESTGAMVCVSGAYWQFVNGFGGQWQLCGNRSGRIAP